MITKFILPSGAAKLILFQRTQYLFSRKFLVVRYIVRVPSFLYQIEVAIEAAFTKNRVARLYYEDMKDEFEEIKTHIPKSAKTILDIGSGLGGVDIFLSEWYQNAKQQPRIYLLDKTDTDRLVYYGMKHSGSFYNSLVLAKDFLCMNGVPADRVVALEANDKNQINVSEKIDLCISLISWGFHYPVATYLERVYEILSSGGTLIIDVRNGFDGESEIQKKFSSYEIIAENKNRKRILAIK